MRTIRSTFEWVRHDSVGVPATLGVREVGTALTVRDVALSIGGRSVLHDVSFGAAVDEVLAVAGEPGFGGTTLARVLTGLAHPDRGDVLIDGRSTLHSPPGLRKVGLVPAGGGLLPQLTAAENIHYARRLGSRSWYAERYVVERRVDRLVIGMGLGPLLDLRPERLSAGQRLRVALARALARSPRVLVLDATSGAEPVFGLRDVLDAAQAAWREAVRATVGPHSASAHPALVVLVCTSDPTVVAAADRVVVITAGRTAVDARPEALRRMPMSLAVARLAHPEGLPAVHGEVTDAQIVSAVRLPRPSGLAYRGPVRVALPADALTLAPTPGGVPGRVVGVRPSGHDARALVVPDALPAARWLVSVPGAEQPRVGARVHIDVAANKMIVFDAADEPGGGRLLWPVDAATEDR